ncbi:MAG: DUF3737 family protein [Clostridia bacterium]|nr:DUF3737 family protein [Clostridia bacterium]
MKIIEKRVFPEERALYGEDGINIIECRFEGELDGESALKECKNIRAERCSFKLRYPIWHDTGVELIECEMADTCRAALWYSTDIVIKDSKLHGIKALRECKDIMIKDSDVISQEFGWMSENISILSSSATGEYFMLRAKDLKIENLNFKGKYSFQYTENVVIEDSYLDTKDAFWHAKNVHIKNSVVKGEYLAWYSDSLTLENCTIIGTQPLCYCKNLKLINCKMQQCDLSFERSDVFATLTEHVDSIKNPWSGEIKAPSVGEIIFDEDDAHGKVTIG